MEDKDFYKFVEQRRLERKRKSRLAFNSYLQNVSSDDLNKQLARYKGLDPEIIEQHMQEAYSKLDESIKSKYKELLKKLKNAQEKLDYLDSIDPYLYELWHLGEVSYYYNGSPSQIVDAERNVEKLKLEIQYLENKHPELRYIKYMYSETEKNDIADIARIRRIVTIKRELKAREQDNENER